MSRTRLPLVAAVAVIVAAAIAVIVATSGASTTKPRSTVAAASAISVKQTSLGATLVDANGRTLYLFEGDRPNVSTLSAAGQAIWPPFTATTTPRALSGTVAGRIGTVAQAGGARPGDLQRTPAVLLRRRSHPGSDERPGAEPVRRPVVWPWAWWQRGHLPFHLSGARERVRVVQLRILSASSQQRGAESPA